MFLATVGFLYKNKIEEAARQGYQIMQQVQTIDDLKDRINDLEEQQEMTLELLSESSKQKEEINIKYKDLKQEVRRLRQENENFKDWADSSVPANVNDLLHSDTKNNN